MVLGLLCALGAAGAYGVATLLQAVGARRAAPSATVGPRLLLRLTRSLPYLAGLGLDAVGFVLALVALRHLPVYVVQSVVAANLAVVALLAPFVLSTRLTRGDRAAVAAVVVGLVALGLSAGPERPAAPGPAVRWGLLAAAVGTAAAAALAARAPKSSGPALGAVAGLGFGVVALCARVLPPPLPVTGLLRDPTPWALAVAAAVGLVVYPAALQRAAVTTTAAVVVVTETLAPAVVAAVLFGDTPRPGWWVPAVLGTGLTVLGAVLLSRRRLDEPAIGRSASGSRTT